MFAESVSFSAAFFAGLLSFFSPCILPLVPAYFSFITGCSVDELVSGNTSEIRRQVILSTLAYVSGFTFVFVLLGASASFVGGLLNEYSRIISLVGGFLVLGFGVHVLGVFRIPGLETEKRVHFKKKPLHVLGTFVIGMAFAAGWSPCIGPILGSILVLAGTSDTVGYGSLLLFVYSMGLAIPFLLISKSIHLLIVFVRWSVKVLRYVNIVSGVLLITVGILLISGKLGFFLSLVY